MVIVLRPATLVRWAATWVAILHVANLIVHFAHGFADTRHEWWLALFDVDAEANVPTWFSSALLFACALGAWLMAVRAKRRSSERRGYAVVATLLVLVSADETVALHERCAAALFPWLAARDMGRGWVWALGASIVTALLLVLLPFLRALAARARWALVRSGAVYVTGALGFEIVGQRYAATHGWHDGVYVGLAAIEELLEMSGCVLFLHAVGRELAGEDGTITLES